MGSALLGRTALIPATLDEFALGEAVGLVLNFIFQRNDGALHSQSSDKRHMGIERICLDTTAGHMHVLKQHSNSPFLQDFFSISQQTKSPEP